MLSGFFILRLVFLVVSSHLFIYSFYLALYCTDVLVDIILGLLELILYIVFQCLHLKSKVRHLALDKVDTRGNN